MADSVINFFGLYISNRFLVFYLSVSLDIGALKYRLIFLFFLDTYRFLCVLPAHFRRYLGIKIVRREPMKLFSTLIRVKPHDDSFLIK